MGKLVMGRDGRFNAQGVGKFGNDSWFVHKVRQWGI